MGRYEFRFTGDDETEALLREARELLSHSRPEIAAIFKGELELVVAEARNRRFAATDLSRPTREVAHGSRDIAAGVQREGGERDGGQCAFVSGTGWRCEERQYLEYHHLKPWIVGGAPSVVNIALRCRAHNQYEAKVYFAPIRRAMENGEIPSPHGPALPRVRLGADGGDVRLVGDDGAPVGGLLPQLTASVRGDCGRVTLRAETRSTCSLPSRSPSRAPARGAGGGEHPAPLVRQGDGAATAPARPAGRTGRSAHG